MEDSFMNETKQVTAQERTRMLIRELENISGLKPTQMANLAGLTPSTLNRFLNGKNVKHSLKGTTVEFIVIAVRGYLTDKLTVDERTYVSTRFAELWGGFSASAYKPLTKDQDAFMKFLDIANRYHRFFMQIEDIPPDDGRLPQHGESLNKTADMLPIIGHVQAGDMRSTIEWSDNEHKFFPIPEDDYPGMDVFGLEVRGDSMDLRFTEGTTLICVRFDPLHDDIPIGKYVVVVRRDLHTTNLEATVKLLEQDDQGGYWLVPQSSSRHHQPVEYIGNGDGNGDIKIHSVVVGAYEKF
jgi:SOS-response transcriptional repressor LexA